ncbi:hypothetical protein MMC29_006461 [Sticta canariensis]|nr:hypothetical protein [Sticta canariensis]
MHELSNAATDHLSLFGAAKQTLESRYTCAGFDISSSKKDSNTAFIRAIRAMTLHLPGLLPSFHEIIDQEESAALAQCSNTNNEGFKTISLAELIESIQDRYNILSYLGDKFANNRDSMKWFRKYVYQAHVLCEVLRLVPSPFKPSLAFLMKGRDIPRKKVYDFIINEIERRQGNDAQTTVKAGKPPDLLDFIKQLCTPDWDVKRLADEVNFIAFSTSVLVSTTSSFAIQDLVLHPEYIMPLRHELKSMGDICSMEIDELPILDSFIKESMRTNCFEASLKDFVFFDSYKITKGDWVGNSQLSKLQDDAQFPNPTHFDGFRFSNLPRTESWKSTQYHQNWPLWGSQKQLW